MQSMIFRSVAFYNNDTGFSIFHSQHGSRRIGSRCRSFIIFKVIYLSVGTIYFDTIYEHGRSRCRKFQNNGIFSFFQFYIFSHFRPNFSRLTESKRITATVNQQQHCYPRVRSLITYRHRVSPFTQNRHCIAYSRRLIGSKLYKSLSLIATVTIVVSISTTRSNVFVVEIFGFILQCSGIYGRSFGHFYPSRCPLRQTFRSIPATLNAQFHRSIVTDCEGQHPVFPLLLHLAFTMVGPVLPRNFRLCRSTVNTNRIGRIIILDEDLIAYLRIPVISHIKHDAVGKLFHYRHSVWREVQ